MNFYKKGQGLSLNMVIVAVLCLIVLVVLVFIFSGKIKGFGQGTKNCASLGGTCLSGSSENIIAGKEICPTDKNYAYISGTDCEDTKNQICCKVVF